MRITCCSLHWKTRVHGSRDLCILKRYVNNLYLNFVVFRIREGSWTTLSKDSVSGLEQALRCLPNVYLLICLKDGASNMEHKKLGVTNFEHLEMWCL
ncbi:hypothetical protein ACET3Z_021980 [Daucus carota]